MKHTGFHPEHHAYTKNCSICVLQTEVHELKQKIKMFEECAKSSWIPVSVTLPKPRRKVLTIGPASCISNPDEPAIAWMGEDGETWWTYGNESGLYKPKYWIPVVPFENLERINQ